MSTCNLRNAVKKFDSYVWVGDLRKIQKRESEFAADREWHIKDFYINPTTMRLTSCGLWIRAASLIDSRWIEISVHAVL